MVYSYVRGLCHTGKKAKKTQNNISSFASSTLAKATFLSTVLLEDVDCHHLAFRVGLFGLEMPRPPASSKALEVRTAPALYSCIHMYSVNTCT